MSGPCYGKRWFRATKQLRQPWDEARARAAHDAGEPYTAVIDEAERPRVVLEVSGAFGFVGVAFLDQRLREATSYQFKALEPGRLFLAMVTQREFEGDREAVVEATSFIFETDGRLTIRKEWFRPHHLDLRETSADVAANHERFPAFGDYAALCREDRISLL